MGAESREAAGIRELVRRAHLLEIAARRNAAGLLAGDYTTAVPGRGMIFHETRKYVPGEPARSIDWNITARLGEPYVKVHLEERQREVFLALDLSPSMHLGLQGDKTKLELAVELAATLALSAVDAGDRLGWVLFADRSLDAHPPRGGKRQLFAFLRALLRHAEPWERPVAESDPRVAIHAIQGLGGGTSGGRFVVFLISDFIDHDLPEDLKYVQARHDVSLLHVYDPLEYAAAGAGVAMLGFAPEGAGRAAAVLPGEAGTLAEMQTFLHHKAGPLRMAVGSFSTTEPLPGALNRFFHRKRGLWR